MTPQQFLLCTGEITWMHTEEYFIETNFGNFIWKNPKHGGDNTVRYFGRTFTEYLHDHTLSFGEGMGDHVIGVYCGTDVIFTKGTIGYLSKY